VLAHDVALFHVSPEKSLASFVGRANIYYMLMELKMQLNPREQLHLDAAIYFTAIRGADPRTRLRMEFDTKDEAVTWANTKNDRRTMIYAVSNFGSAHIMNA
jgi:hypothetical protein